jgi:hypothetical protein
MFPEPAVDLLQDLALERRAAQVPAAPERLNSKLKIAEKMRQAGLFSFFGGVRRRAAAPGSASRRVDLIHENVFNNPWYV